MDKFIQQFADLFDDLDVSILSADTEFRSLEDWDSIAGLSVIAMADEEYEVTLGASDMRACKTIGDLYNKIQEKK